VKKVLQFLQYFLGRRYMKNKVLVMDEISSNTAYQRSFRLF